MSIPIHIEVTQVGDKLKIELRANDGPDDPGTMLEKEASQMLIKQFMASPGLSVLIHQSSSGPAQDNN